MSTGTSRRSTGPTHGSAWRQRTCPWPRWWLFPIWLGVFYLAWAVLVAVGGHLPLLREHWPIAVAMALGSYVAGSTPLGGGTIGFPVLVLLFDQPADIGRQFSFAVQSIGMTSAAVFIIATRRPVAWNTLRWACVGALVGTPIGVALLAPAVNDLVIKLTFAVLWASFGVMHFVKVRELVQLKHIDHASPAFERAFALGIGLFGGGLIASITGVGVDMLVYVMLVLVRRCDLRTAIPTSVILMAFTSIIGVVSTTLLHQAWPEAHPVKPAVFGNWLAAAPIVALGAPLGAFVVHAIPRAYTLMMVSVLCIVQFIWTGLHERLSVMGWIVAIGFVVLCNVIFIGLHQWGLLRAARTNAKSS